MVTVLERDRRGIGGFHRKCRLGARDRCFFCWFCARKRTQEDLKGLCGAHGHTKPPEVAASLALVAEGGQDCFRKRDLGWLMVMVWETSWSWAARHYVTGGGRTRRGIEP